MTDKDPKTDKTGKSMDPATIMAITAASLGALGSFSGNASAKKLKKKELAEMAKTREAQVNADLRRSKADISAHRMKALEDMAEGFRASMTAAGRRR